MSGVSVLLPLTSGHSGHSGHSGLLLLLLLFITSSVRAQSSVAYPITCVTRGADLPPDVSVVVCPINCVQWSSTVFGTGLYAAVSSVCGAAVHRGVLRAAGGPVRVHRLQGRHNYRSSSAHGVQSQALSRWSSSFSVTKALSVPLELSSDPPSNSSLLLPAPVKKPQKKPPVKKVLTGGNKECQVDVAVVMDGSSNIGLRRFNLQKNFVSKLVSALRVGPTGPHVGLVQASDSPRTEFLLSNFTQPKDLLAAIKGVSHLGGKSNTGAAMLQVSESFFSSERGGRRGRPRVLLALVDGWPGDALQPAAILARDAGVNVFMVSVAKAAPEELGALQEPDFISKAVCRDNGFFSYLISSWFSASKHVKPLSQRLCSLDALLCSKTCYNSVNLGFLIDGSSSVGESNFQLVLDFLSGITENFEVSEVGAHVGAVQYTYDQRLEFGLRQHRDKAAALAALSSIRYMSGGTSTGEAIAFAAQHLFSRSGPGRNFLVVVTDGQSYDDVSVPAQEAQRQGVTIFSVGVAWAPLDVLSAMASPPQESHAFFTREFNHLDQFIAPIVRGICRDFSDNN